MTTVVYILGTALVLLGLTFWLLRRELAKVDELIEAVFNEVSGPDDPDETDRG